MQGRLSPLIDGKIQSFPWPYWRDEFALAQQLGFSLMEWTLDQERLYENPLMTEAGRREIRVLQERHGVDISSLTGDCFMQAPFYKAEGENRKVLEKDFLNIASACSMAGIRMIVVPLVDKGRLDSSEQEHVLVGFLTANADFFKSSRLSVIFESDFPPERLARFIDRLDPVLFGINYDVGNSAAHGFRPEEEIQAYGHRIANVHVKDRKRGGTTIPLGEGSADFESVFYGLSRIDYQGNFILQTARASDDDHAAVLCRYRDQTKAWIARSSRHES